MYRGRKIPMLHVGKLLLHFLDDENGPVASVETEFLMAKAESVLQDVISKCCMSSRDHY